VIEIAERAELGLYFRLKAIGATPLIQTIYDVVASMDTMASSLGRMRGGIQDVTEVLGIQDPVIKGLIDSLKVGEGVIDIFTGSMMFLKSVTEAYTGVVKVLNILTGIELVGMLAKAKGAIIGAIASLWKLITTKWILVKANLAVLLSNPFTMALAGIAIVAIGMMIASLTALQRETMKTSEAMSQLGKVTVAGSVFPELVEWLRKVREEARKPIEVKVDVTTRPRISPLAIGRGIGEEVAFELARRLRE